MVERDMLEIGILGLDTSHPAAFADILADDNRATVSTVWDNGDVRDGDYAKEFCERFGTRRVDDPMEMVDTVDAVMVLTANWDDHRRLAVPFLDAGVATLIDKPLVGRVADIDAIADAADGTPLFGGSAVPFHPSITALPIGYHGRTLYCAGYDDPFYYGVHFTSTARLLAGTDWVSVSPHDGPGTVVTITFANDTTATLRLDGPQEPAAFGILDVSDRTRTVLIPDGEDPLQKMYTAFLDRFLAAVRGERDDRDRIVDAGRLVLAVQAALTHDRVVTPDAAALRETHIDGEEFLADYTPYY
jgi:hypothetical protein